MSGPSLPTHWCGYLAAFASRKCVGATGGHGGVQLHWCSVFVLSRRGRPRGDVFHRIVLSSGMNMAIEELLHTCVSLLLLPI